LRARGATTRGTRATHAPDRRLRKSALTRGSILDAAARVFRRRGYSGTTLSDIAAEIGMKAGSLYYHFDSRESLVEAVMALGLERSRKAVEARLRELPARATPLDRLRAAVETHLLSVVAQEHYTSATIKLIWQVPPEIRERQLATQRAYGAVWKKLITDARRARQIRTDLDPSLVRMGILGALNWAADWFRAEKLPPERVARDLAVLMIDGLRRR
jgi:TetR/AcrR family transcriptional regulator, cholesterol catabolism regulator